MTSLEREYDNRYQTVLLRLQGELASDLHICLADTPHIDRINVRAKSPMRFVTKALKEIETGGPKYKDPLNEIQDQLGARVIVFYASDIQEIERRVLSNYHRIETQDLVPETDEEFGYVGRHFVLAIPSDVDPLREGPQFFELQIKTLFQHAWAEASHDLAYKPMHPLTSDERRKMAFTAAQAWGADMIFDELARQLGARP